MITTFVRIITSSQITHLQGDLKNVYIKVCFQKVSLDEKLSQLGLVGEITDDFFDDHRPTGKVAMGNCE